MANALITITREAKRLRQKFPRRFAKWTDYVAEASAIYARKHKGKSPVGKKSHAGRKRAVGAAKRKRARPRPKATVVTVSRVGSTATIAGHLSQARAQICDRIAGKERQKFLAKRKVDKRRIGKEIAKLKTQYRKLI